MTFEHTDGSNQDFVALCHELDTYLNDIVGGEENRVQYRKIGYKVIPNYGQYKDMPESVCMRKEL